MDTTILAFAFASAVILAACVVFFFSGPIDEALGRVVPPEMLSSWRQYVKFALFVVTFAGGLRVSELSAFVAARTTSGAPLTAGQSLMEVIKSITGSLSAAAIALLAFFVATLAIDASRRVYQARRTPRPAPPAPPAEAERRPVGAERHAAAASKERRTSGESENFL
jgi:hypothetical protein